MKSLLAVAVSLYCFASALAATPLRWAFEASRPVTPTLEVYHGETVRLEPTILVGGAAEAYATNSAVTLCYQTNGMGSAWWTAPATITTNAIAATWAGSLDCGASAYRFFFKIVEADGSISYRANGSLKMLDSPGFVPNAIAQPVTFIDFAAVSVSNAPWATPADLAEATEGLVLEESDTEALAAVAALSNSVFNALGGLAPIEDDPVATPIAEAALAAATNAQALAADALPKSATNGWEVGSHAALLSEESDTLDSVIARSPFAESGFVVGTTELSFVAGGSVGIGSSMAPLGLYCFTGGYNATASNNFSFVWQGSATGSDEPTYFDHGPGSLNLNPLGGLSGFWIGETNMEDILAPMATTSWVNSIRGIHADIATNVVYHVVVSNGHWLIQEVQ